MTQSEIFQDMNKDGWDPEIAAKMPVTVQAVFHAVNNTYMKGINPESVEKMREYCEAEKCFAENGYIIFGRTHIGGESAKGILKRMREEALTASKL